MDINQLTEFAGNHLLLVIAFFAIVAMLVGGEIQARISGIKEVTPSEAVRMINHDKAILVDMRDDNEYRDGHIVNALHVQSDHSDKLDKYRDKPIIVYCQRGHRSSSYCSKLRKQGFESVYNLRGGLLAWQKEALPLAKNN